MLNTQNILHQKMCPNPVPTPNSYNVRPAACQRQNNQSTMIILPAIRHARPHPITHTHVQFSDAMESESANLVYRRRDLRRPAPIPTPRSSARKT
ncbi:uncharacterized protein EI90DRAFT_3074399 [Cantharellus anzutake]|uniref:uncharacterized protein n=1 Tax=Cantharellus anzutake TaxID=1750568 RepID=UPI0019056104|nr:uncharacterized protein EI90DRAFT_3074399 [Cantharellus anzutake]KAF8324910.1 hypothetical protein EI90DRAFT_3074399 [Cantharellus anzutake]